MPATTTQSGHGFQRIVWALACVVAGSFSQTLLWQSILESSQAATAVISQGLWLQIVEGLNGQITVAAGGNPLAEISTTKLFLAILIPAIVCWFAGAAWLKWRQQTSWSRVLGDWGVAGFSWWVVAIVPVILQTAALLCGTSEVAATVGSTFLMWETIALAGWLATFLSMSFREESLVAGNQRTPLLLWGMVGLYTAVFGVMNWRLYEGLWIPHGDSAMYEEHLWNMVHGKGFRSYLDQGLFLGEHIQFIHVFLLPIYLLRPEHTTLEICESFALAVGALPIFWMTQRHTESRRLALLVAAAYLLYVPMHFLDIAIDWKTFRPTSFGVPVLLFALDQLERRRYKTMGLLFVLALTAKEDYAIVIAPVGLWIACCSKVEPTSDGRGSRRAELLTGFGWAVGSTLYLIVAVAVLIPLFRSGEEVHYTGYFAALGSSPGEIVETVFTRPGLIFGKLFALQTLFYAMALLLPIGFLPCWSLTRLAVALPMFGMLSLVELSDQTALIPFHHFHAPLVPVIFWAAAAGLANVGRLYSKNDTATVNESSPPTRRRFAAAWACSAALVSGLFIGMSPVGIGFWDSNSAFYWQSRYVPGRRAELFPAIVAEIPVEARVASTDFVHPRFTHHERSYDYSNYARKVSGYELKVPDDTDYIVIDTQHPYSEIKTPDQIREYREQPDQWELLPDETEGYFIVLKRVLEDNE